MIWLIIKSVHFILIFLFFQSGETNLNCFLLSDNVAPVALFDGLHSCVLKFPGEKSKHSKNVLCPTPGFSGYLAFFFSCKCLW